MIKRLTFTLAVCAFALLIVLGLGMVADIRAQDTLLPTATPAAAPGSACGATLLSLWTAATDACINKPNGYFCNGGAPPAVEPPGAVANALAPVGALVEVGAVDALRAPPHAESGIGGLVWLRRADPGAISMLAVGDVTLRDVTPPDLPPWSAFMLFTAPEPSPCPDAPSNVLILQSPLGLSSRVNINGVSFLISGTALVRTTPSETVFAALAGLAGLVVLGQDQPLWAGQQIVVPYTPGDYSAPIGTAFAPTPLEPASLRSLPVPLFDRPLLLPQPGTAATLGAVNLRTEPNTDAAIIVQVPAGEILSVLGSSPSGDWLHVRRQTGESGWMLSELLGRNLGAISASYFLTPLPPQRYGDWGRVARVISPTSINVRSGPDLTFSALGTLSSGAAVTLLERSPYSPWVKVDVGGGVTGWVALVALDTRAFIDALPVDTNVPLPPTITPLPGSFGNAFPDPDNPGR